QGVNPRHWREISDNPNDRRAIAWREARIREMAAPPLLTYEDVVARFCSGRRVLDFGAANHSLATRDVAGSSTHDLVAKYAQNVVAVDVMPFPDPPHSNCR